MYYNNGSIYKYNPGYKILNQYNNKKRSRYDNFTTDIYNNWFVDKFMSHLMYNLFIDLSI